MNKRILFSIYSVLVMCLLLSQALVGQTTFTSQIWATDGVSIDTIYFGLNPAATNEIDVALDEKELPPIPLAGVFDFRFENTPSGSTTFGEGLKRDLRAAVGGAQVDTFVISCQTGTNAFGLSWAPNLSPTGTLRLIDVMSDGGLVNVNMLYTFSVNLPPGRGVTEPFQLLMIRTELVPAIIVAPTSWNFGTVFVGSPVSKQFNISNPGTDELVVSSISSSNPRFEVSTTGPIVIPVGESAVLTVTFNPTAPGAQTGNITIRHNADDWSEVISVSGNGGDPGMYRTFTHAQLGAVDPVKLKFYKALSNKKPDKLEFILEFVVPEHVPAYTTLHLELGGPSLGNSWLGQTIPAKVVKKNNVVQVLGVDYTLAGAIDAKNKKFDYVFTSLTAGDVINIHGFVKSAKPIKAAYWWLPIDVAGKEKLIKNKLVGTESVWKLNMPRLPMPNFGNVAFNIFPAVKTAGSGILVGVSTGDAKLTGWLKLYDAGSMQKTLRGKTSLHGGIPRWFDKYEGGTKKILKENKSLPPEKHNNVLMANLIAFKFNLIASAQGNTPVGLGELLYHNPGNDLHGMLLRDIPNIADPKMTAIDSAFDYVNLNTVLEQINGAFSGVGIDTLPGGFSGAKLVLTGVKTLSEVPFLRRSTLAATTSPAPLPVEIPDNFVMSQNYPNPFNPTTTIEFSLPEDAIVTLKVYNMLGQEVATLINREELSYGPEYVSFDASSLSSGVYIYRLTAEGLETGSKTAIMKKMVLMK